MDAWKDFSLSEIATIEIGGTPSRGVSVLWANEGEEGLPWVSIADLKGRIVTDTKERITEKGVMNSNVKQVLADTLIMSFKLSIGRAALAGVSLYTNEAIAAIVPKDDRVNSELLYYVLPPVAKNAITDNAVKGATLNKASLGKLRVNVPADFRVQQKIAHILQTIDRAIEHTEALIDKYQQIKAGLMHDLFTRGIGPDGQLRPPRDQAPDIYQQTPIGWIPKEWESGKLGYYLDMTNGLKPGPFGSSLKKDSYVESGFKIYGQEQVISGNQYLGDYYVSKSKYSFLYDFSIMEYDILVSLVGTIGKVLVIRSPFEDGIINPRLMRVRPDTKKVDVEFLKYLLVSNILKRQLEQLAGGGTMPVLNARIVRSVNVPIIKSTKEQETISRILDSVALKITSENLSLVKLQKQKSGLMHDLLTGKVPVTIDAATPEAAHG